MSVPETAMHEDYAFPGREHNVRFPGQVFSVYPKSVAACVQLPSHEQFGLRVLGANSRHNLAALFWRESIHN